MRIAGKIATALLLVVYVAAFAGFRLHECSVDHTVEVLLLAGDTCEEVHHHNCDDASHCSHHHHHCAEEHEAQDAATDGLQLSEVDCCANSLHCLTDAQLASDGDDLTSVRYLALAPVPVCPAAVEPFAAVSAPAPGSPKVPLPGRIVLALYSVRRV